MRKNTVMIGAAAGLGLLACGGPYLQWKASPPSATLEGKLAVEVNDKRNPEQGGGKKAIGVQPGYMNIPSDIELDKVSDMADAVTRLTKEAATSAGIGVLGADGGTPTSKIVLDVIMFWCDYAPVPAFIPYTAHITISGTVQPVGGGAPLASVPVSAEATTMGGCQESYKEALTKAFETMKANFSSPPVKQVIVSGGGGAAPEAAPAAPATP